MGKIYSLEGLEWGFDLPCELGLGKSLLNQLQICSIGYAAKHYQQRVFFVGSQSQPRKYWSICWSLEVRKKRRNDSCVNSKSEFDAPPAEAAARGATESAKEETCYWSIFIYYSIQEIADLYHMALILTLKWGRKFIDFETLIKAEIHKYR